MFLAFGGTPSHWHLDSDTHSGVNVEADRPEWHHPGGMTPEWKYKYFFGWIWKGGEGGSVDDQTRTKKVIEDDD